jgi:hypothetical protein
MYFRIYQTARIFDDPRETFSKISKIWFARKRRGRHSLESKKEFRLDGGIRQAHFFIFVKPLTE